MTAMTDLKTLDVAAGLAWTGGEAVGIMEEGGCISSLVGEGGTIIGLMEGIDAIVRAGEIVLFASFYYVKCTPRNRR